MLCQSCRKKTKKEWNFCPYCGKEEPWNDEKDDLEDFIIEGRNIIRFNGKLVKYKFV